MWNLADIKPIDYLVIGHITQDITSCGLRLGGTVSYAALTARALGLRVGILTSCSSDLETPELEDIDIISKPSEFTTTFENIPTNEGRLQRVHHLAQKLDANSIPHRWKQTPIVHLGPVAQELNPDIPRVFPNSVIGVTPQGWLRNWDSEGNVRYKKWQEAQFVLKNVNIAVLSVEDVKGDERVIEEMQAYVKILVVTEGAEGARLYWNGDLRRFRPPKTVELDANGAGDIFATAFFIRYNQTKDPWEAARFATHFAAKSVTRPGLAGVPTPEEVQIQRIEIV
jgi:sugar/nucleoside kinase (ribokinase family)